MLAEIVRLDRAHHRPVAGDSAEVEGLKVLARSHQSLVWERTRHLLRLRQALREYFPAALEALAVGRLELVDPAALTLIARAESPEAAAALPVEAIAEILNAARRRDVVARAEAIAAVLQAPALRQPAIEAAYAAVTATQIALLNTLNARIPAVAEVVEQGFSQHPDVEVYLSQPGLGPTLAPRVLGEFGDAPDRYGDAKARRNYAGTSPITRASGRRTVVLARYARNRRLGDAVHQWAFCALTASPGAMAYYRHQRARGVGHHAALRQVGNRLVGILHGCLKTRTVYNEHAAWAHREHDHSAA